MNSLTEVLFAEEVPDVKDFYLVVKFLRERSRGVEHRMDSEIRDRALLLVASLFNSPFECDRTYDQTRQYLESNLTEDEGLRDDWLPILNSVHDSAEMLSFMRNFTLSLVGQEKIECGARITEELLHDHMRTVSNDVSCRRLDYIRGELRTLLGSDPYLE